MTQEPKDPDPITLVGFELRYAAEQAAKAFRNFTKVMNDAIKKERERLKRTEAEKQAERDEHEAAYWRWKESREGKINL